MPYQERQAFEDEAHAEEVEPGPPPGGSAKFVVVVILIALAAAGVATAFALLHGR